MIYYMALEQKDNHKLCHSGLCPVIVKIWYIQWHKSEKQAPLFLEPEDLPLVG